MPVSIKFASEVMQQSSIISKSAANRRPCFYILQIQIRFKRYNRICFVIIFAIVHRFCKL